MDEHRLNNYLNQMEDFLKDKLEDIYEEVMMSSSIKEGYNIYLDTLNEEDLVKIKNQDEDMFRRVKRELINMLKEKILAKATEANVKVSEDDEEIIIKMIKNDDRIINLDKFVTSKAFKDPCLAYKEEINTKDYYEYMEDDYIKYVNLLSDKDKKLLFDRDAATIEKVENVVTNKLLNRILRKINKELEPEEIKTLFASIEDDVDTYIQFLDELVPGMRDIKQMEQDITKIINQHIMEEYDYVILLLSEKDTKLFEKGNEKVVCFVKEKLSDLLKEKVLDYFKKNDLSLNTSTPNLIDEHVSKAVDNLLNKNDIKQEEKEEQPIKNEKVKKENKTDLYSLYYNVMGSLDDIYTSYIEKQDNQFLYNLMINDKEAIDTASMYLTNTIYTLILAQITKNELVCSLEEYEQLQTLVKASINNYFESLDNKIKTLKEDRIKEITKSAPSKKEKPELALKKYLESTCSSYISRLSETDKKRFLSFDQDIFNELKRNISTALSTYIVSECEDSKIVLTDEDKVSISYRAARATTGYLDNIRKSKKIDEEKNIDVAVLASEFLEGIVIGNNLSLLSLDDSLALYEYLNNIPIEDINMFIKNKNINIDASVLKNEIMINKSSFMNLKQEEEIETVIKYRKATLELLENVNPITNEGLNKIEEFKMSIPKSAPVLNAVTSCIKDSEKEALEEFRSISVKLISSIGSKDYINNNFYQVVESLRDYIDKYSKEHDITHEISIKMQNIIADELSRVLNLKEEENTQKK